MVLVLFGCCVSLRGCFSVGACLASSDRIFVTVYESCVCFCLISGRTITVRKGPGKPKTCCDKKLFRSYLSPLSLLLGRDPCGDRILRICLQKASTTAQCIHFFPKIRLRICLHLCSDGVFLLVWFLWIVSGEVAELCEICL